MSDGHRQINKKIKWLKLINAVILFYRIIIVEYYTIYKLRFIYIYMFIIVISIIIIVQCIDL